MTEEVSVAHQTQTKEKGYKIKYNIAKMVQSLVPFDTYPGL